MYEKHKKKILDEIEKNAKSFQRDDLIMLCNINQYFDQVLCIPRLSLLFGFFLLFFYGVVLTKYEFLSFFRLFGGNKCLGVKEYIFLLYEKRKTLEKLDFWLLINLIFL